ncbi:NCS2 family permease [uncultured Bacteroides sp.]|uniref:NCS2 family permease n=1 Tax=uncultured Bacteroides sp. TaxID=162156 RepID=UPI002AA89DA5|nr:NCS2 family permease [uncultured Bacteroides sp.]
MKFLQLVGYHGQTSIRTECIAGLTTFLTMSYILAVNPDILSQAGMSKESVFTATALASAVATLCMAFLAKLPIALAPAMGVNAFFAFTLVQGMGLSWQTALAAVLIEGVIFIFITLFNIREAIVNSIPMSLRYAISAGIGMFISFIGLKNAGIIVPNAATFVMLGKFTPVSILAVMGILLSGILMKYRVKGALFYSIIACTIIGIPMGVTQLPEHFSLVSMPHSMKPTFMQFDFSHVFSVDMFMIVFVLIFMDLFDTIGTLIGVTAKAGIMDKDGNVPHIKQALLADAIGTTFGAICGTSTVGSYVESASGISEGGRTGLTALTVSGLFLLSLFFAPLFLLIPSAATTGALFIVGVLMISNIPNIDLSDITEALPAFVTMLLMVLTYSIADGIILGMLSYVVIKLFTGEYKKISITMYVLSVLFILKLIIG